MNDHALLLRLNPNVWPVWQQVFIPGKNSDVWFITGRRRADRIHPSIPVVVLGTHGLGIVGYGETVSGVEYREDPDWKQVSPELQKDYRKPENRVCVKIRPISVPLQQLKAGVSISQLHRTARETTTWLGSEQYQELISMIHQHNQSIQTTGRGSGA